MCHVDLLLGLKTIPQWSNKALCKLAYFSISCKSKQPAQALSGLLISFLSIFYFFFLVLRAAFFSSITLLAANLFLVLGECLDFFIFLSPVGRFAIYFIYMLIT